MDLLKEKNRTQLVNIITKDKIQNFDIMTKKEVAKIIVDNMLSI